MNVLESPLEALAVNYLSLGVLTVVNNLWTWVAVITAAFSFWRIRAAGGATVAAAFLEPGDSPPPPHRNDQSSSPSSEPVPDISVPDVSSDEAPAPACPAPGVVVGEVEFDVVTKGIKFVAMYKEDDEEDECRHELTAAAEEKENEWDDEKDVADGVDCGEWWESWDKVLRMRTGEKGWYRYQDMTVINGNVVRLWEGSKTRNVIRYRPRCVLRGSWII